MADHAIPDPRIAKKAWDADVEAFMIRMARTGQKFTSEDLTAPPPKGAGMPPGHPNTVGATLQAFHREGRIIPTGWTLAKRPSSHAAALRTWRIRHRIRRGKVKFVDQPTLPFPKGQIEEES